MAFAIYPKVPPAPAGYGAGIHPHRSLVWLIEDPSNAYQRVIPELDTGLVCPAEVETWVRADFERWATEYWAEPLGGMDGVGALLEGVALALRWAGYAAIAEDAVFLAKLAYRLGDMARWQSLDEEQAPDYVGVLLDDASDDAWSDLGYTRSN